MIKKFCLLIFALSFVTNAWSLPSDFASCVVELGKRAKENGISSSLVEQVTEQLELQPRVLELDRAQPEFTQTFANYLNRRVNQAAVEKGRRLFEHHSALLNRLTRKFGIPGQYLIAFWGLETNYGSYLGNMKTLDSLATLACDNRRSDYFAAEFLHALDVVETHEIDHTKMRGSWAGAVGHTQFMPSNYNRYAIDGDGDGRVNLWQSQADALSSAANFLQNLGWQRGERWGREIILPTQFNYALAGLNNPLELTKWHNLGATQTDGTRLPQQEMKAALIVPAGHKGPAFLAYENFKIIMKWNRSIFYALAVGHLADRIAGGTVLFNPPSIHDRPLTRAEVTKIQQQLLALGYQPGSLDGIIGPATRSALQNFQTHKGMVADGYPSPETLVVLAKPAL